ncbi:conserved Plasmodium protein, unknown function [Plasmodium ovale]|uniref:KHDC4/BBP-like KH-domain type I domain-containing protein n=2 Tax=Plasmodium ovale TaxID=36330 RepID=A0A1A8WP08_PLAOA|nr:conserved Plasmodium protein, unknown function [Plasmodium ovale curtisi]SBS93061.1 conserved Plasmodium protein, unknown function [Plasmodium ovale curtisi]SCQ16561.1 conserved Plasmodium protein, unknown function [Plasmodium ovale]
MDNKEFLQESEKPSFYTSSIKDLHKTKVSSYTNTESLVLQGGKHPKKCIEERNVKSSPAGERNATDAKEGETINSCAIGVCEELFVRSDSGSTPIPNSFIDSHLLRNPTEGEKSKEGSSYLIGGKCLSRCSSIGAVQSGEKHTSCGANENSNNGKMLSSVNRVHTPNKNFCSNEKEEYEFADNVKHIRRCDDKHDHFAFKGDKENINNPVLNDSSISYSGRLDYMPANVDMYKENSFHGNTVLSEGEENWKMQNCKQGERKILVVDGNNGISIGFGTDDRDAGEGKKESHFCNSMKDRVSENTFCSSSELKRSGLYDKSNCSFGVLQSQRVKDNGVSFAFEGIRQYSNSSHKRRESIGKEEFNRNNDIFSRHDDIDECNNVLTCSLHERSLGTDHKQTENQSRALHEVHRKNYDNPSLESFGGERELRAINSYDFSVMSCLDAGTSVYSVEGGAKSCQTDCQGNHNDKGNNDKSDYFINRSVLDTVSSDPSFLCSERENKENIYSVDQEVVPDLVNKKGKEKEGSSCYDESAHMTLLSGAKKDGYPLQYVHSTNNLGNEEYSDNIVNGLCKYNSQLFSGNFGEIPILGVEKNEKKDDITNGFFLSNYENSMNDLGMTRCEVKICDDESKELGNYDNPGKDTINSTIAKNEGEKNDPMFHANHCIENNNILLEGFNLVSTHDKWISHVGEKPTEVSNNAGEYESMDFGGLNEMGHTDSGIFGMNRLGIAKNCAVRISTLDNVYQAVDDDCKKYIKRNCLDGGEINQMGEMCDKREHDSDSNSGTTNVSVNNALGSNSVNRRSDLINHLLETKIEESGPVEDNSEGDGINYDASDNLIDDSFNLFLDCADFSYNSKFPLVGGATNAMQTYMYKEQANMFAEQAGMYTEQRSIYGDNSHFSNSTFGGNSNNDAFMKYIKAFLESNYIKDQRHYMELYYKTRGNNPNTGGSIDTVNNGNRDSDVNDMSFEIDRFTKEKEVNFTEFSDNHLNYDGGYESVKKTDPFGYEQMYDFVHNLGGNTNNVGSCCIQGGINPSGFRLNSFTNCISENRSGNTPSLHLLECYAKEESYNEKREWCVNDDDKQMYEKKNLKIGGGKYCTNNVKDVCNYPFNRNITTECSGGVGLSNASILERITTHKYNSSLGEGANNHSCGVINGGTSISNGCVTTSIGSTVTPGGDLHTNRENALLVGESGLGNNYHYMRGDIQCNMPKMRKDEKRKDGNDNILYDNRRISNILSDKEVEEMLNKDSEYFSTPGRKGNHGINVHLTSYRNVAQTKGGEREGALTPTPWGHSRGLGNVTNVIGVNLGVNSCNLSSCLGNSGVDKTMADYILNGSGRVAVAEKGSSISNVRFQGGFNSSSVSYFLDGVLPDRNEKNNNNDGNCSNKDVSGRGDGDVIAKGIGPVCTTGMNNSESANCSVSICNKGDENQSNDGTRYFVKTIGETIPGVGNPNGYTAFIGRSSKNNPNSHKKASVIPKLVVTNNFADFCDDSATDAKGSTCKDSTHKDADGSSPSAARLKSIYTYMGSSSGDNTASTACGYNTIHTLTYHGLADGEGGRGKTQIARNSSEMNAFIGGGVGNIGSVCDSVDQGETGGCGGVNTLRMGEFNCARSTSTRCISDGSVIDSHNMGNASFKSRALIFQNNVQSSKFGDACNVRYNGKKGVDDSGSNIMDRERIKTFDRFKYDMKMGNNNCMYDNMKNIDKMNMKYKMFNNHILENKSIMLPYDEKDTIGKDGNRFVVDKGSNGNNGNKGNSVNSVNNGTNKSYNSNMKSNYLAKEVISSDNFLVIKKYTAKYEVQIDPFNGFDIAKRIIGLKGTNMKKICIGTDCKLRLRGRGSGYLEGEEKKEANESLHLCVSCQKYDHYILAKKLIEQLLVKIYMDYDTWLYNHGKPYANLKPKTYEKFIPLFKFQQTAGQKQQGGNQS